MCFTSASEGTPISSTLAISLSEDLNIHSFIMEVETQKVVFLPKTPFEFLSPTRISWGGYRAPTSGVTNKRQWGRSSLPVID